MFSSLGDYTSSCIYPNIFFYFGCQRYALHVVFYIVNASKPDCCCSALKNPHIIDTLYGLIIYLSNADGTFQIICILSMVKCNLASKNIHIAILMTLSALNLTYNCKLPLLPYCQLEPTTIKR